MKIEKLPGKKYRISYIHTETRELIVSEAELQTFIKQGQNSIELTGE
jgi:hypothetical protein